MKVQLTRTLVLWLLLGLVGYYVVFQTCYNLIAFDTVYPYHGFVHMLRGIIINFVPTFLQSLFITMVVFWPSQARGIERKIIIDIFLVTAMLIVFNFSYSPVMRALGFPQLVGVNWGGSIFNAIFVFLGVETTFYVLSFKNSLQETEAQKQLALQYRYDALKAQVNPHFLFNSLNILNSLVSIDQQKSKVFIESLSSMYRYVMAQHNCDRVSLVDEMKFLDDYVSILSMRYNQKFVVNIVGQERMGNQQIIPFTLQLLIENVTKHNVISSRQPMTVSIVIGEHDITITNPIHPRAAESVAHFGLNYLTELYKVHHRTFRVTNDSSTFTAIVPYL